MVLITSSRSACSGADSLSTYTRFLSAAQLLNEHAAEWKQLAQYSAYQPIALHLIVQCLIRLTRLYEHRSLASQLPLIIHMLARQRIDIDARPDLRLPGGK